MLERPGKRRKGGQGLGYTKRTRTTSKRREISGGETAVSGRKSKGGRSLNEGIGRRRTRREIKRGSGRWK